MLKDYSIKRTDVKRLKDLEEDQAAYLYFSTGTAWTNKVIIQGMDYYNPITEYSDLYKLIEWTLEESSYHFTKYNYNYLLEELNLSVEEVDESFYITGGGEYIDQLNSIEFKDSIIAAVAKSRLKDNISYNKCIHLLELNEFEEEDHYNSYEYNIKHFTNKFNNNVFLIEERVPTDIDYRTDRYILFNSENIGYKYNDIKELLKDIKEEPFLIEEEGGILIDIN